MAKKTRWCRGLCSTKFCLALLASVAIAVVVRLTAIQPIGVASSSLEQRPRPSNSVGPSYANGVDALEKQVPAKANRLREVRQGGPGSNDVRLKGECSGPVRPSNVSSPQQLQLKQSLITESHAWGYFDKHERHWTPLQGLRVLDVGMGQGPICVVAIETGVHTYTGLDPALCIDKPALTRNKKVDRVHGRHSCKAILNSEGCQTLGRECPAFKECKQEADSKYKRFPFSAIQMMDAYRGAVNLLPGTFETLRGTEWLRPGMFDVATLWSVTEHLPDNRAVLEGIFSCLEPGQVLRISHHNYYGYDGHHEQPKTPKEYDEDDPAHAQLANWMHVEPGSFVQNKSSLNRVRLGDLMATVDVYFRCSWVAVTTDGGLRALTQKVFQPFHDRGFKMTDLLISRWHAACVRREAPLPVKWMGRVIWHHPPLDGRYKAQPVPKRMHELLVVQKKSKAHFFLPNRTDLKQYLPPLR